MRGLIWIIGMTLLIACQSENGQSEDDINPCHLEPAPTDNYTCAFDVALNSIESDVTDSIEQVYLALWKTILLEKANMTETYFNDHFSDIVVYGSAWKTGINIKVSYVFTLDWIQFRHTDKFLVWLNSSENAYQHLDIPRDEFLNKEKIELVLEKSVANASIAYVQPIETLAFSNCEETINTLRTTTGFEGLLPNELTFRVVHKQPRIDGYPYLIAFGQKDINKNECVIGYINLFTGEAVGLETFCCIIG